MESSHEDKDTNSQAPATQEPTASISRQKYAKVQHVPLPATLLSRPHLRGPKEFGEGGKGSEFMLQNLGSGSGGGGTGLILSSSRFFARNLFFAQFDLVCVWPCMWP